jgi:hypothetical protein
MLSRITLLGRARPIGSFCHAHNMGRISLLGK